LQKENATPVHASLFTFELAIHSDEEVQCLFIGGVQRDHILFSEKIWLQLEFHCVYLSSNHAMSSIKLNRSKLGKKKPHLFSQNCFPFCTTHLDE
jgi:hypothetical protein